MNRWLESIRLPLRRIFNECPAHAMELENIALRARVNWMRAAIEDKRRLILEGLPPRYIAEELDWILEQDAQAAEINRDFTEVLNERTA
jgi:hypothetical protein